MGRLWTEQIIYPFYKKSDIITTMPTEEPVIEQEQNEDVQEELPEEVSDRTKQEFEKLKKSNQELKAERDALLKQTQQKNLLEELKPTVDAPTFDFNQKQYAHLNEQQAQDIYASLVDENGYVDTNLLKKSLQESNERVRQAEERARRAEEAAMKTQRTVKDIEESALMQKVHAEFPEIDPKSQSFNRVLFDAVRNELVSNLMGKGDRGDVMEVTRKWHSTLITPKKEEPEIDTQLEAKKQIAATTPKTVKSTIVPQDYEYLRQKTMTGDSGALSERLKRSGY